MNYISFDIGGTKTKYAVITDNYKFLEKGEYPTLANNGRDYILSSIISIINKYNSAFNIRGVAVSSPGVIDFEKGIVLYTNDRMPNYAGLNFKQEIYNAFKLKCSVENDVNCFALAETIDNNQSYLMITIGTGIGGAIVIDNKIYHGFTNSAGEFGQMLINEKKWEDLASMKSLVDRAKEENLLINEGYELFQLYDEKNEKAIKLVDNFYNFLALGICNLTYIFNPRKIILGGGITKRANFINELTVKIDNLKDPNYFSSTEICVSKYQNDGGLIGALVHYFNK